MCYAALGHKLADISADTQVSTVETRVITESSIDSKEEKLLRDQIKRLEKDILSRDNRIRELESKLASASGGVGADSLEKLKAELNRATERADRLKKENENLKFVTTELENNLKLIEAGTSQVPKFAEADRNQMAILKKAMEDMRASYEDTIRILNQRLKDDKDRYEKDLFKVSQANIDKIFNLNDDFSKKRDALIGDFNSKLKQSHQEAQSSIKQLSDSANSLAGKLGRLNPDQSLDELIKHRLDIERLAASKKYESQIEDLLNQVSSLRAQVSAGNNQNDIMRITIAELKHAFDNRDATSGHVMQGGWPSRSGVVIRDGTWTAGASEVSEAPFDDLVASKLVMPVYRGATAPSRQLTNLRRARIFNKMIKNLRRTHLMRSFYKIFASNVISLRSGKEAGARLKGRLLEMLMKRFGDVGAAKKAFLRWSVVINPNLIRASITKVAICSRIKPHIAIWRLKKLIEKGIRIRLPQATIRARMNEGLHLLNLFIRLKNKDHVITSFNKIRPGIIGRLLRLLISILNRKSAAEEGLMARALKILRQHNQRINEVLRELISSLRTKQKSAFERLLNRNRDLSGINSELAEIIVESTTVLTSVATKNVRKSLITVKLDRMSLITHRLLSATDEKKRYSLQKLRDHNSKFNDLQKLRDRLRKLLVSGLSTSSESKKFQALNRLKENARLTRIESETTTRIGGIKKDLKDKLIDLLGQRLKNSQASKKRVALSRLVENYLHRLNGDSLKMSDASKKQMLRDRLVNRLVRSQKRKVQDAQTNLIDHKNEAKRRQLADLARRLEIFRNLLKGSHGKLGNAYERLRANAILRSNDDKFRTAMDKLKRDKITKGLSRLAEFIRRYQKDQQRHGLDEIRYAAGEAKKRDELEKQKRELALRRMQKVLKDLLRSYKSKTGSAMTRLMNNCYDLKMLEEKERSKGRLRNTQDELAKNEMARRLANAQKLKIHDAMRVLKDLLRQGLLSDINKQMKTNKMQEILKRILSKLVTSQKAKKAQAMSDLQRYNFLNRFANIQKRKRIVDLLNQLVNSQRVRTRLALDKLGSLTKLMAERNHNRFLRGKMLIDNLSSRCQDNLDQSREAAYHKMVMYAKKATIVTERVRLAIARLLAASKAKLKDSLGHVRRFSLYETNRSRLNETLIDQAMDREMGLKRKLFKTLVRAHMLKMLGSFRNLRYLNDQKKETDLKMKDSVSRAILKCQKNMYSLREACYHRMILYSRLNKDRELRLRKGLGAAVRRIDLNSRQNMFITLAMLTKFKDNFGNLNKLRTKIILKLLSRLRLASEGKLNDSIHTLIRQRDADNKLKGGRLSALRNLCRILNNKLADTLENAFKSIRNEADKQNQFRESAKNKIIRFINGLLKAQQFKEVHTFSKLKKLNTESDQLQRKKINAGQLLTRRLVNGSIASEDAALILLKNNRLLANERMKELQRVRNMFGTLLSRSQAGKMEDALKILRLHANNARELETIQRNRVISMIRRLVNAHIGKQQKAFDALDNLKNHSLWDSRLQTSSTNLMNKIKIDRFIERLSRAYQQKRKDGIYRLIQNNQDISSKQTASTRLKIKLFRNLVKSQQTKVLQSVGNLKQNKEGSLGNILSRRARLTNIFNNLLNSHRNKLGQALGHLRDHNRQEKNLNKQKVNKLRLIDRLLDRGSKGKLGEALDKLRRNVEDVRKTEKRQISLVSDVIRKLNRGLGGKTKDAFDKLRAFGDDAANRLRKKDALRRKVINELMRAYEVKKLGGLQKLLNLSVLFKDKERALQNARRNLLTRLLTSHETKQRQALDKLRRTLNTLRGLEQKKHALVRRLLGRLVSSHEEKQRQSLQGIVDRLKKRGDKNSMINRLKHRLMNLIFKTQRDKLYLSLDELRKHARKQENSEIMNRTKIENDFFVQTQRMMKVLKQLSKAQYGKLNQASGNLKFNRKNLRREDEIKSNFIKLILRKLHDKQDASSQLLKDHSIGIRLKELNTSNLKRKLAKSLIRSSYSQMAQAFYRLAGRKPNERSGKFAVVHVIDRIVNRRYHQAVEKIKIKSSLVLQRREFEDSTRGDASRYATQNARINDKLSKLAELVRRRLKNGYDRISARSRAYNGFRIALDKAKMRHGVTLQDAFMKLRLNHLNAKREAAKLGHILDKAGLRISNLSRLGYNKLVQNSSRFRSRLQKFLSTIQKGAMRVKLDTRSVLEQLKMHKINQELLQRRLQLAFERLLRTQERKKITAYYRTLVQHHRIKHITYVRNSKMSSLMDKLVLRRKRDSMTRIEIYGNKQILQGRQRLTEKNAALHVIIKTISKNHSFIQKQYFDRWVSKPKMSRFIDLMRMLIKDRLHHSFSQIKLQYELSRRDRVVRFFNEMDTKMRKLTLKSKKNAYDIIKKMFYEYNPWEKRVIDTWVFKTSQTVQHSFWRARYNETIGTTLVSIDKKLKITRFVDIMKRAINQNLDKSLVAINTFSQVQEVIQTQMFGPSSPRLESAGHTRPSSVARVTRESSRRVSNAGLPSAGFTINVPDARSRTNTQKSSGGASELLRSEYVQVPGQKGSIGGQQSNMSQKMYGGAGGGSSRGIAEGGSSTQMRTVTFNDGSVSDRRYGGNVAGGAGGGSSKGIAEGGSSSQTRTVTFNDGSISERTHGGTAGGNNRGMADGSTSTQTRTVTYNEGSANDKFYGAGGNSTQTRTVTYNEGSANDKYGRGISTQSRTATYNEGSGNDKLYGGSIAGGGGSSSKGYVDGGSSAQSKTVTFNEGSASGSRRASNTATAGQIADKYGSSYKTGTTTTVVGSSSLGVGGFGVDQFASYVDPGKPSSSGTYTQQTSDQVSTNKSSSNTKLQETIPKKR